MTNLHLGKLLHLSDPTLPIGGYTHSNGLETYVQKKLVHDVTTTKEYLHQNLWQNLKYNDAAFLCLAYKAAENNDIDELIALDTELSALKNAREPREASEKLGIRLFKIFSRYLTDPLLTNWQQLMKAKQVASHYCILYGIISKLMEIPLAEALYSYYYNQAITTVTNAVKLVPLGQLDGQDILYQLHNELPQLCKETLELERDLIGMCSVGFELRSMQHERLYTRIYIS